MTKKTDAPTAQPIPLATLADLECATITVEIELSDGVPLLVPCKLIPQWKLVQIGSVVPNAQPPLVDYAAGGKPVYNYSDPGYIAAQMEVNFRRNCLQLAAMIQIEIPDADTNEKRADYIRDNFDPRVTEGLAGIINQQIERVKARILTRAETFLGG